MPLHLSDGREDYVACEVFYMLFKFLRFAISDSFTWALRITFYLNMSGESEINNFHFWWLARLIVSTAEHEILAFDVAMHIACFVHCFYLFYLFKKSHKKW